MFFVRDPADPSYMKGGTHRDVLVRKDAYTMDIPVLDCPGLPESPKKEIKVAAVVLPMPGDAATPIILVMLPMVMQCLLHHLMKAHGVTSGTSVSMTEQERERVAVLEWCWTPTHAKQQDIVDRVFFAHLAPLVAADLVGPARRIITPLSIMDARPGQVMTRERQNRVDRERRAVLEAAAKQKKEKVEAEADKGKKLTEPETAGEKEKKAPLQ